MLILCFFGIIIMYMLNMKYVGGMIWLGCLSKRLDMISKVFGFYYFLGIWDGIFIDKVRVIVWILLGGIIFIYVDG